MIIQLIYNFSAIIALSVLSGVIDQFAHRRTISGKILQGLLFGGTALIGMLYPLELAEGLFFDGRSIVISLATLFFGPVTGLISALMPAIYRWQIGGPGLIMGLGVIISSFLVGWIFFQWRKIRKLAILRYRHLLLFGLIVHIIMVALIATLPSGNRGEVLQQLGLVILLFYPAITLLMGIILTDQEQNRKMLVELKQSENYLNTIFRSIGDALVSLDKDLRIMGLNSAAEQLLGFNSASARGKHIDELLFSTDEGLLLSSLMQVTTDYAVIQPVELKLSNQKTIRIAGTVSMLKDEENRQSGWVFSMRDISREQEYESRLQAWGESYKGLFNSILSSAFIQNEKGEFLDVNQAAVKLYGYPYERFMGQTPEFLSAPGLNDMNALANNIKAAYNGASVQFEYWGMKASGEIFPKEVFLFPTVYFGQRAIVAIAHDISERKEAENKIRLSEARYKNLFEASPLGIILEDLDGTIISANAAFCREYGYEPIELIGKNIRLLANPENKTLVQKNIEQIIQHGKLNSQIKATTKKGQIIDLELIESLIDLPDGRKGILSICKNITEQIAAEQAKKESEQKTSAIIHAIPDLIFIINKAGIFTEYFASSDQDLLMLPQDFAGQPVEAVLPPFLAASTKEHLNKVLETQSPSAFEYELSIRQKTNYFEARMVPLGDQQALTLVRNITEKKQTEKAIKQQNTFISTLLDSIPNPLFYMDKDSVYLGVNKAFTEFFNVKREDIVGKNMFDWDDHTVALKNHIDDLRIFEGREAVQMLERTITLMNGEQRNVLLNKSAFHTSEGEVAGLIGLIIDISDRKKNELELLAAKEKAEESDRLKTSFLQNMNHEIRTPLNAILGFSDLLFEDVPDEQKREFVNIININAEQLLHIIDEVLIISRMDAERIIVEKQAFALDALMQDLKLTFTNPCIDKNLDLIVNKTENADYQIYTDRAKLRQVLSGLIDNAVKYTTKGSISLGYTVDGRDLRINVTDTGIGIPHEEQHRIFDRFFRGERPQRLAIRGNGLGLSIVSSMVNLLNGHIEVQSEPGQGSTFTLFLPGAVILDSQNDASDSEMLTELPRQSQLTFLIAEDEDDNFEYLSALAINHAATVLRARNGKEAIRLLEANHIDIVLIDIKMPVMDGLEATRIIRATYPKLPIVIQTAYSQPDEVRMAIEAGANDVLIKPIKKEVFYQVIQRLLG